MNSSTLETDALRLRPIEPDDLDFVVELHNDLSIKTLTLGWRLPVSRELCAGWIAKRIEAPDEAAWIAVTNDDEQIGVVRVFDIDAFSRRAEIGLYLAAAARGRGFGRMCVQLARDWCLEFLGLHRVVARVLRHNGSAVHVFESLGFEREGILVDHEYRQGSYQDVVMLALLRPDA